MLRLLHRHAWLPGAMEIVSGLYSGGFEAAQEHVRAGKLDPQSLRCARLTRLLHARAHQLHMGGFFCGLAITTTWCLASAGLFRPKTTMEK